jgi:hypothetical protein
VVSHLQWATILFKVKTVLHDFRTFVWSSTNFMHCSQWDYSWTRPSQVLSKMGSKNAHRCTQNTENGFGFDVLELGISQSHCRNNKWWNLGFIHKYRNQRAVKTVDAHTFIKQAKKFKQSFTRKLMATVFWDRTGKCWWWNSYNKGPQLQCTAKHYENCAGLAIQNKR